MEDVESIIESTPPTRAYRTRASKNVTAGSKTASQRSTRTTRNKKTDNKQRMSEETPAPIKSIPRVVIDCKVSTPVKVSTPFNNVSNTHIFSPQVGKATAGHVKNKITAYEEYISPVNQGTKSVTLNDTNVPDTPDYEDAANKTPATVVRQNHVLSLETVEQTPTNSPTPTMARKSRPKSLRRSLKVLPSKVSITSDGFISWY